MRHILTYYFIILLFLPITSFANLPSLSYPNTTITYGQNVNVRATAKSNNSVYSLQNIPSGLVGHISIIANDDRVFIESTAPAGIYTITVRATDNTGSTDASFTLTVNKAILTVTAAAKTITYCDPFPTCTANYSGFQNLDNLGSLTGSLICNYGVTAPAPAGTYTNDITASTLANPNYTINYVNNTLIVDKSPSAISLVQSNSSIIIGESVTYTATVSQNKTCIPTGTLTFTVDGVAQSPIILNNLGVASITIPDFGIGVHTVFASFSGSDNQLSSISSTISTTVCPIITIGNLANGIINVPFNQTISVAPSDSYTFSIPIGHLPRGLTLNSVTGQISGIPSESGFFSFTIVAKNGIFCSKSKAYNLKILGNNCANRYFETANSSPIITGAVPFAYSPLLPTSLPGDYHLATDDFNNDGILDIIMPSKNVSNRAAYSLYLGNGSGGFSGGTPIPTRNTLGNNIAIVVADFDNDGDKDIVFGEANFSEIVILTNDGLGSFTQTTTPTGTGGGGIGTALAAASGDFNQDGKPDFVITNADNKRVQVFLNTSLVGQISFSNLTPAINTGILPRSIVVGHFNADENLDFATADYTDNTVSVSFGDGLGGFSLASTFTVGLNCRDIATGDFDNDGDFDLVTANYGESTISILANNGSGNFTVSFKTVSSKMNGVLVNDFNGDGFCDILTSSQLIVPPTNNSSFVYLLYNDGNGNFATPTTLGTDFFSVGLQPGSLVSGDFNQDGSLDFISANIGNDGNTGSLSVILNNCPPIATNFSLNHGIGVSSNIKISTAFDGNQAANTLIPQINSGNSAIVNGVSISNLTINPDGNIMADVSAICSATNATFSVSVTDNFNKVSTATLSINIISGPIITSQPTSQSTCDATQIIFPVVVTGLGLTYQWQVSTNNGSTFSDLLNSATYAGATSDTLKVLSNSTLNGYKYKCLITGACSNTQSNIVTLNVQNPAITLSGVVPNGTVQVYNSSQINSTQKISQTSQIEYRSGKSIVLTNGFFADSQSVFKANIIGCQ